MEVKEKEKTLHTSKSWESIFQDEEFVQSLLNKVLHGYLKTCRWFGGKSKRIKQFKVQYLLHFPVEKSLVYMVILESTYMDAYSESYFLPLYFVEEDKNLDKKAIISPLQVQDVQGFLIDALYAEPCRNALFHHIVAQKNVMLEGGLLHFNRGNTLSNYSEKEPVKSTLLKVEQSNTSIIYNDKFFLKIYRNLFRETNPDYEITKFLTENSSFKNIPAYAGSITWKRPKLPDVSIGLMQEKVENEGDAWTYLNQKIKYFFEKISQHPEIIKNLEKVELYKPISIRELDPEMVDLMGYETLKSIHKIAQRTAEMHIAISSDKSNYTFLPIAHNEDYAVWLKNRFMYQFDRRVDLMEKNIDNLEGLALDYAKIFLENKEEIINTILNFDESKLISKRIRIHGDYHLGQVLKQGDDFIILDFEGEPESTIRDRKVKQPAIKDVAGMLRSFDYAVYANIFEQMNEGKLSFDQLTEAGNCYYRAIVSVFLNTYLKVAMDNSLDIGYYHEIKYILKYHLLEKAIYELGYELNSRPTWAIIPLRGIVNLLEN